jgi:fructokinase
MPKAICIGELLIDFATSKKIKMPLAELIKSANLEELMTTLNFGWAPGGAPANVSVGLAKLEIDCGFIGKIGNDPFGDILKKTLADCYVDVSSLKQEQGARTTLAFVATREDESKDIFFYRNPGADILLQPEDIDASYIESAEIFHWGSVSLSHSPSREAAIHAIQIAADNGLLMSFDPNWRPTLWDAPEEEAKSLIWKTMKYANIAKLAEEEWEFITGTSDLDEGSKKLLDVGVNLVVVTRGKEGCYYNDGISKGYVEGFEVNVVDPLGAGDGFVAAMLFELMKEEKSPLPPFVKGVKKGIPDSRLREIMVYANAAGALTCRKPGVIPALPTTADIEQFLSERGFKY